MSHDQDATLDRALAALPQRDLGPLEARALLAAAEQRLRGKAEITRWMRAEPVTITALALAHLCWALARVYLTH